MTSSTSLLSGVLLVDKPVGPTSHDVVGRLRRLAGQRRVGHVGTLDPMASGLLVACLGRATRVAQFLVGLDKIYEGAIELGAVSSTYDAEGAIARTGLPLPDAVAVAQAMAAQLGERMQLPPPYSAIKVKGKKLYEYARAGQEVPIKPRWVRIHRFDLIAYDPPLATFEAKVGSGAYIRSMAHDLGAALGCGACLTRLRRTRVGGFDVQDACALDDLEAEPGLLEARLLAIEEALGHLPKLALRAEAEAALMHGRAFATADVLECDGIPCLGRPMLVIDATGRAMAIAEPMPLCPEGDRAAADANADADANVNVADHAPVDAEPPAMGAAPMVFRPLCVLCQPENE
jgi:tRNA pseudouridine55 synthase